ncbi:sensor histidine kinase [Bacillus salitolerans]|uniref:Sensor histidine kinase n=1 Tax=Bacillus salitolerans TaxID=1437434 RepID=A0ABW4LXK6_9BACI
MSIIQRQILTSIVLCLFIFLILSLTFFSAFPIEDWSYLWGRKIMDVPFIVIAPSISIIGGIVFGVISGMSTRSQLKTVTDTLQQIEQGKQLNFEQLGHDQELASIWNHAGKIQKQMMEQVKLSQKLATEKAEDLEKRIQEMVSQERNRLARELHDSVSQQLFAASMLMSAITEAKSETDDLETKQLKMVEETIHQSQLEMRALLLHLRPVALKGKSLQEGIEELLTELLQKVPMEITWKIEDEPMDKGVEDHLFRILQESVSNTLRHAKASKLEVLLIKRDEFIILRVVDDGKGFDVETSKTGSYGLQNMYERAVEIGGSMKIISLADKGTRLEVKVPVMGNGG